MFPAHSQGRVDQSAMAHCLFFPPRSRPAPGCFCDASWSVGQPQASGFFQGQAPPAPQNPSLMVWKLFERVVPTPNHASKGCNPHSLRGAGMCRGARLGSLRRQRRPGSMIRLGSTCGPTRAVNRSPGGLLLSVRGQLVAVCWNRGKGLTLHCTSSGGLQAKATSFCR